MQEQTVERPQFLTPNVPTRIVMPEAEALETRVDLAPRYCLICDADEAVIADRILGVSGYIGACARCGDEKFVPFKRTTVEVVA